MRAHREYLPGDVFGYSPRNTRSLLQSAMERIAAVGEGVILYLKRESDAIASDIDNSRAGVTARRNWYLRASTHLSPPEADFRDYGIGAQILRDVGVRKMILLSDQAAAAGQSARLRSGDHRQRAAFRRRWRSGPWKLSRS